MILYAPTEQDFDELSSLDDAFQRSEAIAAADTGHDDRDPWTVVLVDFFDDGEASDWAEAQPITMADLAIMCGDAS